MPNVKYFLKMDVAGAREHFGAQFDITAIRPNTYRTDTGAVRCVSTTVTVGGREYIVRNGETLPESARN